MEARKLSEESVPQIQLLLRICHPTIDPQEISTALGVEPEHCFKCGDSVRGGRGLHTQTYWWARVTAKAWLEPVDPSFLSTIASRYPGNLAASAESLGKAAQSLRSRTVETMLLYGLHRLNARQGFLERIQNDGGDVSLMLSLERGSASDFTLPVAMSRLLAKLGITLEFKFDP